MNVHVVNCTKTPAEEANGSEVQSLSPLRLVAAQKEGSLFVICTRGIWWA